MRRFTRLALGFSKKIENLEAAVNLHVALTATDLRPASPRPMLMTCGNALNTSNLASLPVWLWRVFTAQERAPLLGFFLRGRVDI
jgi:hypothetical protein